MKKNINLIIDGIAPEKVMYDTDNHSLVVLYPAQKEFKRGDIVFEDGRIIIVKDTPFHYYVCYYPNNNSLCTNDIYGIPFSASTVRLATPEEQQILFDALKKEGKKWNAETLEIVNIPQRKFKPGDRVILKNGMIDKRWEYPYFVEDMHVFIGKVLTVESYNSNGHIHLNEAVGWKFAEDWLELYSDEPIIGELAIFWDSYREFSRVKIYKRRNCEGYYDHNNMQWKNAIKFISKEQFLEHIKG